MVLPDPPSYNSESSIWQRSSFMRSDSLTQSATKVIGKVLSSAGLSNEVPYRVDDTEILCSICLESMDEEEGNLFTISACSHTFHIDCIAKWKKISRKCPCCRGVLPDDIGPTLSKIRNLPGEEVSRDVTGTDIFKNVIFSVVGIAYPIILLSCFVAFETIFLVLFIVFFFFMVIYFIYAEDDTNVIAATGTAVTGILLSPLLICVPFAAFLVQIFYLLYRTLKFYAKVFMCKMRWMEAYGFVIERTINLTGHFLENLDLD